MRNIRLVDPRDEDLLDVRHHLTCPHARDVFADRYLSQVHELESLPFNLLNHHAKYGALLLLAFGQEEEAGTVVPLFGYGNTLQQDEFVRNLQQDASTVTRLVACLGTTVFHVFQYPERIVHQFVAFASVDVDHHAHSAGIVFVL